MVNLALDPEARWEAMAKAEKIVVGEDYAIGPIYQRGVMIPSKTICKRYCCSPIRWRL